METDFYRLNIVDLYFLGDIDLINEYHVRYFFFKMFGIFLQCVSSLSYS